MITIPFSHTRLWLLSFWLVMTLFMGVLIGILSWILVSSLLFELGMILVMVLALSGLLWPKLIIIPYESWNRLANDVAYYARLWVMGVCFYIIFLAVGRTGSSLRLSRPDSNKSMWVPRGTLEPSAYFSQYEETAKRTPQQSWISIFLSWAIRSGNLWACCLLPFLILLRALDTEEESCFPTNIYTLY